MQDQDIGAAITEGTLKSNLKPPVFKEDQIIQALNILIELQKETNAALEVLIRSVNYANGY